MTLLAIFIALVFLHSLVSDRLERTVVTAPIVFRTVRELLLNVVKHAHSPTAKVSFHDGGDHLRSRLPEAVQRQGLDGSRWRGRSGRIHLPLDPSAAPLPTDTFPAAADWSPLISSSPALTVVAPV